MYIWTVVLLCKQSIQLLNELKEGKLVIGENMNWLLIVVLAIHC